MRHTIPVALLLCALTFGMAACQNSPDGEAPLSNNLSAIQKITQPPQVVAVADSDPVPLVPVVLRARRRMNIDQLDAAIRRATGGIGWDENGANQFEALQLTLGKPDYLDVTQEDLSVSTLFMKFLDDAARHVCQELMVSEQQALLGDRVFFVHAEPTDTFKTNPVGVAANLRMLLLRYHGRKIVENSTELEPWTWYMDSASHVSEDTQAVWEGVCVGLMTHPHFYTY